MSGSKPTLRQNDRKTGVGPRPGPGSPDETPGITCWLVPLVIFALTVLVFLPSLQSGFVNWDDDRNFVENRRYRGLGWEQLGWMFTTFHMGHYQPLSWMTLGLDYLLWGMNPFGYHLTNLLLHAANALFFYFLALRLLSQAMLDAIPGKIALRAGAAFAALFFAVHPLRVESVAWITERRDVLSALFLLGTVLCYLRAVGEEAGAGRWRWMGATVGVYILSLLSKAGGITLPVVLLVLDIYPLRRLGGDPREWFKPACRGVWLEKIPFLILAVITGVVALFAQHEARALKSFEQYGPLERIAQILFGMAYYPWKTILPVNLSPLYDIPVDFNPWEGRFVLSEIAVLAASAALFCVRRRWPAGLASWAVYVALLLPVSGIAQSGVQIAADRYTYLSCAGWALLAGAGLLLCWRAWARGSIGGEVIFPAMALSTAIVVGLGALTWRQEQLWHDSERLWRHVLSVSESFWAHHNLASALSQKGRLEEAVEHFREALRINPTEGLIHAKLGGVLAILGDLDGAIEHLEQAKRHGAKEADMYFNLATALVLRGRLDEAIENFQQALSLNPDFDEAHYRLGDVLAMRGEVGAAIQEYREALELNPGHVKANFNLGNALALQGLFPEALDRFQQALKSDPNFAQAHHNLGRILASQGRMDDAIGHFRQAVRIQPDFAAAHESLAMALAEQGKRDEAIRHHQEALRIMKSGSGEGRRTK